MPQRQSAILKNDFVLCTISQLEKAEKCTYFARNIPDHLLSIKTHIGTSQFARFSKPFKLIAEESTLVSSVSVRVRKIRRNFLYPGQEFWTYIHPSIHCSMGSAPTGVQCRLTRRVSRLLGLALESWAFARVDGPSHFPWPLCPRAHNFALPIKDDRNFISRVSYRVLN